MSPLKIMWHGAKPATKVLIVLNGIGYVVGTALVACAVVEAAGWWSLALALGLVLRKVATDRW